jgi:hypothetical protein
VVYVGVVCACGMTRLIAVITNLVNSKISTYTPLTIASANFPDGGKKKEKYHSLLWQCDGFNTQGTHQQYDRHIMCRCYCSNWEKSREL